MVDEGEAAVEAVVPVTACGEARPIADSPDVGVEAIGGAEKILCERAAAPSPSTGSGGPRLADAPHSAPSADQGVGGAPDGALERRFQKVLV